MLDTHRVTLDDPDPLRFALRIAPPCARCLAEQGPPEGGTGGSDGRETPSDDRDDADEARKGPQDDASPPGGEEQPRDWKAEYLREAAQSRKYRQRAQKTEILVEQLTKRALSEEQCEEYRRLRLAADELQAKDQAIARLEGMVKQMAGMNELSKALVACGVGSGCSNGDKMLAQAAALLSGRIDVDVSGETPLARVLDPSGSPMLGGDGEGISIRKFVADWLAQEGAHFLPPSLDTGSGAHKGGIVPPGIDIESLDRDVRAKAEFIARNGPQAYVQLAQRRRTSPV